MGQEEVDDPVLAEALGGFQEAPDHWVTATEVIPVIHEDPGIIWLEEFGPDYGLFPDDSPYSFGRFVAEKGQEYQREWLQRLLPEAPQICDVAASGQFADRVRESYEALRGDEVGVVQPALWCAPDQLYGVPDLVIRRDRLAEILAASASDDVLSALAEDDEATYVIVDFKFTSDLESSRKSTDLEAYTGQLRVYTRLLGQLLGEHPNFAYIVPRDRALNPLPVEVGDLSRECLPPDLADFRDHVQTIRRDGAELRPWTDEVVALNTDRDDFKWNPAKKEIQWNHKPGRDPGVVHQIGHERKKFLRRIGCDSLDSLLAQPPEELPLEDCPGLGPAYSERIRTILRANGTGDVAGQLDEVPPRRDHELFVDFEYFTNVNVDFERDWPILDGREMIFAVGAGMLDHEEEWVFRTFTARNETLEAERLALSEFLDWLTDVTGDQHLDPDCTALYHWTYAERSQASRAGDRHGWADQHPIRNLPWIDLQRPFTQGPCCLPGMWKFGLKDVASSLSEHQSAFTVEWPEDLTEGLDAMVLGWRAYERDTPLRSDEMDAIHEYLEVDCRALERIRTWLTTAA